MLKECKTSKNCWKPGVFPLETMLFAKLLKPPSGVPHHRTTHRPARTIQSGPCQLMCTPIGPQVHEGINKTKKKHGLESEVLQKCFCRCVSDVFFANQVCLNTKITKSETKKFDQLFRGCVSFSFPGESVMSMLDESEVCSSRSQHACLQSSGHQVHVVTNSPAFSWITLR